MSENRLNRIKMLIKSNFQPVLLEVYDESGHHHVGKAAETHYKVIVVSDKFNGQSLIKRHRQLNDLMQDEFDEGLHALTMHLFTQAEWEKKNNTAPDSPNCRGGFIK